MGFFDRLLGRGEPSSGSVAKERLQLVLVHDRVQLSPALLESLRDDLIQTISRYLEIDQAGVEISLSQNKRESRLTADIPIVGARNKPARSR